MTIQTLLKIPPGLLLALGCISSGCYPRPGSHAPDAGGSGSGSMAGNADMTDPFYFQETFERENLGDSWSVSDASGASCQLRIVTSNTTDCSATVAPSSTRWLQLEMDVTDSALSPGCGYQLSIDKSVKMNASYSITFWQMIKFDSSIDADTKTYGSEGLVGLVTSNSVNGKPSTETGFSDSSWMQLKIPISITPGDTEIKALSFTLIALPGTPLNSKLIGCIDDITVAPQN